MRAVLNLLVAVLFGAMTVAAIPAVDVSAAESTAASQDCGPNTTCIELAQTGCVPNNQPIAQGQRCCTGVSKFVNGAMRCVAPTASICNNPAVCCGANRAPSCGNCNCPP